MTALPKVSVITPVFNGEKYVKETFFSVTNQDYARYEYILVDDGSTDRTFDLLSEVAGATRHVPVRLLRQTNQGEASAINNGLTEATGDYVCVVSADDPLLPRHLASMVQALEEDQGAVVAYPDWQIIDRDSYKVREVRTLDFSLEALIGDFVCLPGPGALIRRSAIRGTHLRDARYRYVSDYAAWLDLAMKGSFKRVPEFLASYRIHDMQATKVGRGSEMANEIEDVIVDFFNRQDLQPEIRRMRRRARAFSMYYASLQKIYDPTVPGRRRVIASFLLAPPRLVRHQTHRRDPVAVMGVLFAPISSRALSRWRDR